MIISFDTVFCQVDDMSRAVTFYRDVLGLTPMVDSPHWTSFRVGSIQIGLHPRFMGSADENTGNWIAGFAVEDVEAFRDHLRAHGAWCSDEFHQTPGGRLLDFKDPEGNMLQAIQRG